MSPFSKKNVRRDSRSKHLTCISVGPGRRKRYQWQVYAFKRLPSVLMMTTAKYARYAKTCARRRFTEASGLSILKFRVGRSGRGHESDACTDSKPDS